MNKYYILIRKLHLYFGLFISPFVIIFSIGLLVFNHPGLMHKTKPDNQLPEIRTKLRDISYNGPDLETAKRIIHELGIQGEIDYISRNNNSISFPLINPGLKSFVHADTNTDSVFVSREVAGALSAMAYLHSMPGPHNAKIRGNSLFMKVWMGLADAVVYLLIFLTASGVFLWYAVKAEIKNGSIAISLGILVFVALLIAIF